MAANMQQMAGGQMMGQQQRRPAEFGQQITRIVAQSLTQHGQPTSGWQSGVPMAERLGKITNLITNMILSVPGQEWRVLISQGIEFERKLFNEMQDKAQYDRQLSSKMAELVTRRQANDSTIRADMGNQQQQAAQQAAAMAQQQQQLMMNRAQFQSMPTQQPGLQHLQHQMQVSPIPQQQTQPMGFNMPNAGMPMAMNNPQMGQMGMPGQMRQNMPPFDITRLSEQDKAKVAETAARLANKDDPQQKQAALIQLQAQFGPGWLQNLRAQGKDPLSFYYQRKAFQVLTQTIMKGKNMPGMGGIPPNASPAQLAMLQQQQQQQQRAAAASMNPGMMNNPGQQHGPQGSQFASFTDMNSIMNGQKEGMMAEQSGQQVVPASSQPGPRTTPQPMQGHGVPNGQQQQAPGQRPPGMPQQFFNPSQLQQANAQTQAQIRAAAQAQANQFPKQGAGGSAPASQGPGMNTLNAPMQQPIPMAGMDGQRTPQGTMPFAQGMDPRFNQRPHMMPGGPINHEMLSAMSPEQRQALSNLPPEKLADLMTRWRNSRAVGQQGAAAALGQGMRGPGQLPHNLNMGNVANQFGLAGGLPQQANPTAPQQQGFPQAQQQQQQQPQEIQLTPQQQVQQMTARLGIPPQQQQAMMDSLDLPAQLLTQLQMPIPPEVKKWRDFKAWAGQGNSLPDNVKTQLANMQFMQFRMLLLRRNQMPQAQAQPPAQMQPQAQPPQPQNQAQNQVQPPAPVQGQMPGQGLGQQRPVPQAVAPMPGQPPNGAAGLGQLPASAYTVTAQEIAQIRMKHPQFANTDDNNIRKMVIKLKHDTMMRNLAQHMRANGQAPPQQQPAAPGSQAAAMKPDAQPSTQAAGLNQTAPPNPAAPAVSAPTSVPAPAAAPKVEPAVPAPNRARPPPTPTTGVSGGRKRPVPDDSQESAAKPVNTAQAGTGAQGPPPHPQLPGNMTQGQFAKFNPEQQKHILMRTAAQHGQNVPPETKEILNRLRLLGAEEDKSLKLQTWTEISMNAEDKAATDRKLIEAAVAMKAAGKSLVPFFQATRDEARSRMFFRYRHRLAQNFVDSEYTIPKPMISVGAAELEQMKIGLTQLVKEAEAAKESQAQLKRNQAAGQRPGATAAAATAAAMQQRPSQQQSQPVPLNQANLEENNRAHNKMHNQSNSKSAQGAPAAPTTSVPPFPIHAASPHGQPKYAGSAQVTQDSLHLPNKKRKTSAAPTTGQLVQPLSAGQTPKMQSPTVSRQPAPAPSKPLLMCPEPDCDWQSVGFATEEARKAHIEEEHTKPYVDPLSFFQNNLSTSLGLDASGHALPMQAQPAAQMGAPMETTLSKQGQTPATKVEPAGVTMSRAASMNRQVSGGAVKTEMVTPGKMMPATKAGATPRLGDIKTPAPSMDVEPVTAMAANNPWDMSYIDPQDLSAVFNLGGESAANGAISDFTIYRNAFTPNDTPESSKDSGSSEPNSDISEGAHLDIDLNVWSADESLLLEEMTKISMRPMDDLEGADIAQALMTDPNSLIDWDSNNLSSFYDKPSIELDPSLYSFDTL